MMPFTGVYECRDTWHEAPWDAGTWTPTTIRAKVATEAMAKWSGSAIFELLPVFWSAGYEDVAPTATYVHTYVVAPAAVAVPKPLTARFGAVGTNIGGTGPTVILKDLYLRNWKLTGNVTGDKIVTWDSEFFGVGVDDNSGAGTAFIGSLLPTASAPSTQPTLEVMKALNGKLELDDAGVAGGAFTTMTALSASLLDWDISGTTGLEPAYSGDGGALITSFGLLKYVPPVTTMRLTARLSSANYALIYGKYAAGTYQELQFTLSGASSRSLVVGMTGVFTECRTAHARNTSEVVMDATFTAQSPHTQIATPHYLTLAVNSLHNWT
jgi:hypothetical protein